MPYYYWWDPTYFLVIIGAVICLLASAHVNNTFKKYSKYRSMSGMTGAQAAQRILNAAGIYDVEIRHISGKLTDHYDPRNKTLSLSDSVYSSTSVAAVGVADFRNEKSYDDEISKRIPAPNEAFRNTEAKADDNAYDKNVDAVKNHF